MTRTNTVSYTALAIALCAVLVLTGCHADTDDEASRGTFLAMIPKGTTHHFWTGVEQGARLAEKRHDLRLKWKGPLKENDRAGQIQLVQRYIALGVDGLLLAPLDRAALVTPVSLARAKGIPVIIFDSPLDGTPGEDYVSFVGTDNREAGKLAGHTMVDLLGGNGDVVLLRHQTSSPRTLEREEGFLQVVREAGLGVLEDNRFAGPSVSNARSKATHMLDALKRAQGIFCSNESTTHGMLLALRREGLMHAAAFVGFDTSPELVRGLESREISALILQDPERIGELAVETMARHLAGQPVETRIDSGAIAATLDNMDDPEIARLLR